MAEMKVYQRDHFRSKINDLLDPEIEKEEMLLSSTIADMTESAEKNLAKKIGADIIITDLEKAEQELEKARNKARTFFRRVSRQRVSYKNSLDYNFAGLDRSERSSNITPNKCKEQIRTWAEKLAEKEAEKLPIGKRISYLRAVKTNANDSVMEAHVGSDLKDLLGDILKPLGLSWQRPLPAIAPPSEDRPED